MKNKPFEDWLYVMIKYYSPMLGIELHNIEVEKSESTKYLEITCPYPYLDPVIRYCDKASEDWKNDKLKSDRILHELCHIITDPLYSKATSRYVGKEEIEDERERLTDTVAAIVRRLIK